ncbi:hypothetical protein L198_07048 [Cryptococcus wingfieldii CBS 7118]|uniref:3'-5' exonuclease domain-containing protein n=1 Tax=Cryptococcus wingfieldii CBS 7118 TaxID=1295528 RepID=A0A1E3IFP7_9TREE|nr:hypothetical protein L198_07048 [Cryptococcus wingfieldii CBS 7118]ODN87423.1 hypothetical protein L198_07048 [Cryptococcus wingfieldii CBS 7118]
MAFPFCHLRGLARCAGESSRHPLGRRSSHVTFGSRYLTTRSDPPPPSQKPPAIHMNRSMKKPSSNVLRPPRVPTFDYKLNPQGSTHTKPKLVCTSDSIEIDDLLRTFGGNVLAVDIKYPSELVKERERGAVQGPNQGWYKQGRTTMVAIGGKNLILLVPIGPNDDIPDGIVRLLTTPSIFKVGGNILKTCMKIHRDFPHRFTPTSRPQKLLDLAGMAQDIHPHNKTWLEGIRMTVSAMCQVYIGKALTKDPSTRMEDFWGGPVTEEKIDYAANHVHATYIIFRKIQEMAFQRGLVLDPNRYLKAVELRFKRHRDSN